MICRLIAKYRPSMPVLSVVIPRLKTNQLRWSFTGVFEVREQLFFLLNCVCDLHNISMQCWVLILLLAC